MGQKPEATLRGNDKVFAKKAGLGGNPSLRFDEVEVVTRN